MPSEAGIHSQLVGLRILVPEPSLDYMDRHVGIEQVRRVAMPDLVNP